MKDRLWAPWRLEYVKSDKSKGGCVFCHIIKEDTDRENLILYRGRNNYIVLNRYPYNSGHLMVVPNKHTDDLSILTEEALTENYRLAAETMRILKKTIKADGFNCGLNIGQAAGAGIIGHLHFHVVPRWEGDTNFFPVVGGTKSMPALLDQTYETLIQGFEAL